MARVVGPLVPCRERRRMDRMDRQILVVDDERSLARLVAGYL